MKNHEKIIELGAEGGSVSIFLFYDEKGNDWYYHQVQEMSFEDVGISGVDRKSKFSKSLVEAMLRMINEYSCAMRLYPVYCNLSFKPVIVEFLKSYRSDIEMHKKQWFELLQLNEFDLE